MLLSTQSLLMQRTFGYETGVKKLAEIGFDAYDFTMFDMAEQPGDPMTRADYKETCRSIRNAADKAGIACNQTHAPFPSVKINDRAWNETMLNDYLIRSLEVTALLGGEACVIHPCNDWSAEENAEKLYRPLAQHAKRLNVQIAVENMWNYSHEQKRAIPAACSTAEDFVRHMDLLDPERFVACLDIGHAEMLGDCVSAVQLIHALGSRLHCLHVHDNDKMSDWHTIPYTGNIAWDGILQALHDVKYDGDFTFEAGLGIMKFPPELQTEAHKLLCAVGRYMISKIES